VEPSGNHENGPCVLNEFSISMSDLGRLTQG